MLIGATMGREAEDEGAQTPHRLMHYLHGGDNNGKLATTLAMILHPFGKTIGVSKSTESDLDYVVKHSMTTS